MADIFDEDFERRIEASLAKNQRSPKRERDESQRKKAALAAVISSAL